MKDLTRFLPALALVAVLALPFTASALGFSFGGRIITPILCASPFGPAVFFTIAPAGVFPIGYIWAPGALGLPPSHPGQQILGVADTLVGCTVGAAHFSGFRVQLDGVSI